MRLHLYQQEYLDFNTICSEISKETNVLFKTIEKELWAAFWRGDFINKNGESMLVWACQWGAYEIPLIEKEMFDESELQNAPDLFILITRENDEIKMAYPLFKDKFSEQSGLKRISFPELWETDFIEYVKNETKSNNRENNIIRMDESNRFMSHIKRTAWCRHIEVITKYYWLERAMMFAQLQNNPELPYKPKTLAKWGWGETVDASEQDYQKFAEHQIVPRDYENDNTGFWEHLNNPLIRPIDLVSVLSKFNKELPEFLLPLATQLNCNQPLLLETPPKISMLKTVSENNKMAANKKHEHNNKVKENLLSHYDKLPQPITDIAAATKLLGTGQFKIINNGIETDPDTRTVCLWISQHRKRTEI